jgi:hypothetical protein
MLKFTTFPAWVGRYKASCIINGYYGDEEHICYRLREEFFLNISLGRSQHRGHRKYNLSYLASETLRVITGYTLLSIYVKSYKRASVVTTCFVWV